MDLQGVFVEIGDFFNLKGPSLDPLETGTPKQINTPDRTFCNAPSLHTLDFVCVNSEGCSCICPREAATFFGASMSSKKVEIRSTPKRPPQTDRL